MLGFGALGRFALGQVGNRNLIVPGVAATGLAGAISATTGSIPSVFGTGVAGIIIASTLTINPHRVLANVVRRMRKLGRTVASPQI